MMQTKARSFLPHFIIVQALMFICPCTIRPHLLGIVCVIIGHVWHTGGKKCVICGERVAHDKWNISPRLAEQRWAQHQARLREIDEVVDFLS